jgi:hypothetical protein
MTQLVLQTQAIKINKKHGFISPQTGKRVKGSDYVVFKCPDCLKRNNQCVVNALYQLDDGVLVFRCNQGCGREIEVSKPQGEVPEQTLIVTPEEFEREKTRTLDMSPEAALKVKARQGHITRVPGY